MARRIAASVVALIALLLGVVAVPLGLYVFSQGERYAKQHGKLKRSG